MPESTSVKVSKRYQIAVPGQHLYMGYQGKLPPKYLSMQEYVDVIQ